MIHSTGTSRPVGSPLQEAKHELVREAIRHAALDLFTLNGFDATTVEEIAEAAGVSRRSFFRYFSSKSDLVAQQITAYGEALAEAISAVPRTYSPLEVIRDVVLRISAQAAQYPRSRQIMQIVRASAAAREAQISRRGEVEDRVAQAFAERFGVAPNETTPTLLASLVLSIMDVTVRVWFDQPDDANVSHIAEQVIAQVIDLVSAESAQSRIANASRGRAI